MCSEGSFILKSIWPKCAFEFDCTFQKGLNTQEVLDVRRYVSVIGYLDQAAGLPVLKCFFKHLKLPFGY